MTVEARLHITGKDDDEGLEYPESCEYPNTFFLNPSPDKDGMNALIYREDEDGGVDLFHLDPQTFDAYADESNRYPYTMPKVKGTHVARLEPGQEYTLNVPLIEDFETTLVIKNNPIVEGA